MDMNNHLYDMYIGLKADTMVGYVFGKIDRETRRYINRLINLEMMIMGL